MCGHDSAEGRSPKPLFVVGQEAVPQEDEVKARRGGRLPDEIVSLPRQYTTREGPLYKNRPNLITCCRVERCPRGRRSTVGNRVGGASRLEGSNPSLSAIFCGPKEKLGRARRGTSGALYPKSAYAGSNPLLRRLFGRGLSVRGKVDNRDPRNRWLPNPARSGRKQR